MHRFGVGYGALGWALITLGCGDDAPAQAVGGMGGSAGTAAGGSESAVPAAGTGGLAPAQGGSAGSAGRDDSGGEAGAAEAMLDPCAGVSAVGECVTPQQARVCVVPTGNGSPLLVTTDCREFEHCEAQAQARCVLNTDACVPNQTECVDTKRIRSCDAHGAWQLDSCSGSCKQSAAGAFCVNDAPSDTITGTLSYDAVPPQAGYDDWAEAPVDTPAEGVFVLAGDGTNWTDSTLVDENGAFSIQAPTTKTGNEQLAFLLLHPDPSGAFPEFGVFDPDVPDGIVSTSAQWSAQAWSFSVKLASLPQDGRIRITEQQGSGAVHIYKRLLEVHRYVSAFYQRPPGTIAAWLHLNSAWDCGTCFAPWPAEIDSMQFDSQLFISATAQDRGYWSDAVTVHEAGHFTMWSYGFSPNEGGEHCLGQPTAPGQAWSEGWATGFSSILRDSPSYWDKQLGAMFWFDLGKRQYQDAEWKRPSRTDGLLQQIDENEVAAMIWSLSRDAAVGADAMLAALRAPSVTQASFKRGYTRHVWEQRNCKRTSYADTGESSPMFADYLDGLRCAGAPADAIDRATLPQQYFPYPSEAPLCQ